MRHFFVITFLSLCLATTAVAAPPTSRPTATKPPMTHLEIDPMLLRAKDGKVRTIQQLDLARALSRRSQGLQTQKVR
ncbi:MAG: hypothetical protein H6728_15660 [Myxococcales bacterium]|nr:hypothetical protein [Myxococcales bacterium]